LEPTLAILADSVASLTGCYTSRFGMEEGRDRVKENTLAGMDIRTKAALHQPSPLYILGVMDEP